MTSSFVNDALGCNSVTWAPYTAVGNLPSANDKPSLRLATGSCDNTVRVWRFEGDWDNNQSGQWVEEKKIGSPHENWVRGVAWAPNTAMPYNIIGTSSSFSSVIILTRKQGGSYYCGFVILFCLSCSELL